MNPPTKVDNRLKHSWNSLIKESNASFNSVMYFEYVMKDLDKNLITTVIPYLTSNELPKSTAIENAISYINFFEKEKKLNKSKTINTSNSTILQNSFNNEKNDSEVTICKNSGSEDLLEENSSCYDDNTIDNFSLENESNNISTISNKNKRKFTNNLLQNQPTLSQESVTDNGSFNSKSTEISNQNTQHLLNENIGALDFLATVINHIDSSKNDKNSTYMGNLNDNENAKQMDLFSIENFDPNFCLICGESIINHVCKWSDMKSIPAPITKKVLNYFHRNNIDFQPNL